MDQHGEVSPFRRPARIAYLNTLLERQEARKKELISRKAAYSVVKPPGTSPGRMQRKGKRNLKAHVDESSDRKVQEDDTFLLERETTHELKDDEESFEEWDREHKREDSFANEVEQQRLYLESP